MKEKQYSEFPHLSHQHMEILLRCFSACSACAKMCIEEGNRDTAILCNECADVCALTIKWHSADSSFTSKISEVCSEVCEQCSKACGSHHSEHCQQCSEICQECAKACTAS